jgi:L-fuculose-phosphate aldolase
MLHLKPGVVSPAIKIKEAGIRLSKAGLSPGCSGNISMRGKEGFFISPSATTYEDLEPDDMVLVKWSYDEETITQLRPKPSSEWRFHRAIYLAYAHVNAVVHCHTHYAQVLACLAGLGKIPANFHYMMQIAGGSVRRMPYETPGSQALAESAVEGLRERTVVLLGNHGSIAVGADLETACDIQGRFEELCRIYADVIRLGAYAPIPQKKMEELPAFFKNYGQKK